MPAETRQYRRVPFKMEKCARHTMAYGLQMDAPTLQSNLDDCPGSKMSLSIVEFIYFLSMVFDGVEDR